MTDDERRMLTDIHHEMTHRFQSRYVDPDGVQSTFEETSIGYQLEGDAKGVRTERGVAELLDAVDALTGLVTKLAAQIGEKR